MRETSFVVLNDIGWPIRGEVRRCAGSIGRRLVVISHGFKGFKDWGFFPYVSQSLAQKGFTVVAFNFSGSGIGEDPLQFTEPEKFGANTFSREIADLTLVVEKALAGALPDMPRRFESGPALLGHSRGGLDSLFVARQNRTVERVVTWSGIGSLHKRFDAASRGEWRARGYLEVVNSRTGQVFQIGLAVLDDLERHFDEYDPIRVVPTLDIPLLIVHGTADVTIPLDEARELLEAARPGTAELVAIPGAGHTFNAVHPFQSTTPELEAALRATEVFLSANVV